MKATQHTLEVYNAISNKILELQTIRDHFENEWTDEMQELHDSLSAYWDELRILKSFYEPDLEKYLLGTEEDQASETIKFARKKMGLTQKELAEMCNVSERSIQNMEAGTDTGVWRVLKTLRII